MGGQSGKGCVADSVSGVIDAPSTSTASLHHHQHHHHHNVTNLYLQSSGDAASVHSGIDMRLDSVSAILKAKGVTFNDTDDEVVEDTKTFCSVSSANNSVVLEMGEEEDDDEEEEDGARRRRRSASERYFLSPVVKFKLSEGEARTHAGSEDALRGEEPRGKHLSEMRECVCRSEPSVRPKVGKGGAGEALLRRSVSVVSDVTDASAVVMATAPPVRSKSHPKLNDI